MVCVPVIPPPSPSLLDESLIASAEVEQSAGGASDNDGADFLPIKILGALRELETSVG